MKIQFERYLGTNSNSPAKVLLKLIPEPQESEIVFKEKLSAFIKVERALGIKINKASHSNAFILQVSLAAIKTSSRFQQLVQQASGDNNCIANLLENINHAKKLPKAKHKNTFTTIAQIPKKATPQPPSCLQQKLKAVALLKAINTGDLSEVKSICDNYYRNIPYALRSLYLEEATETQCLAIEDDGDDEVFVLRTILNSHTVMYAAARTGNKDIVAFLLSIYVIDFKPKLDRFSFALKDTTPCFIPFEDRNYVEKANLTNLSESALAVAARKGHVEVFSLLCRSATLSELSAPLSYSFDLTFNNSEVLPRQFEGDLQDLINHCIESGDAALVDRYKQISHILTEQLEKSRMQELEKQKQYVAELSFLAPNRNIETPDAITNKIKQLRMTLP